MQNNAATQVLELLTYRLVPGLGADAFLGIVAETAPRLQGFKGLLSRSLVESDGLWTEMIRWASQADADAAGAVVMQDPALAPLMAALDPASLSMRFLPLRWQMPG